MAAAGLTQGVILLPFALLNPPWAVVGLAVLSGLLEAAYAWFLASAYERGALSITYPIGRGTAPSLATLGGWAPCTRIRGGPVWPAPSCSARGSSSSAGREPGRNRRRRGLRRAGRGDDRRLLHRRLEGGS